MATITTFIFCLLMATAPVVGYDSIVDGEPAQLVDIRYNDIDVVLPLDVAVGIFFDTDADYIDTSASCAHFVPGTPWTMRWEVCQINATAEEKRIIASHLKALLFMRNYTGSQVSSKVKHTIRD